MGEWKEPWPDGQWCLAGWAGCSSYTGGHSCLKQHEHRGAHRCDCGATTTRKDALEARINQEDNQSE